MLNLFRGLATLALMLLGIADVFSTHMALNAGGVEANPLIRWAMGWMPVGWGFAKIVITWIVAGFYFCAPTRIGVEILMVVLIVFYVLVTINNLMVAGVI